MKVCNEIKRQIDEADHPDQLGLEVSRHTAQCADCRMFASKQASLRGLLASGERVSVPMNFDAVLNARLAEARAQKSFLWLSPASYLRLGAATAALAVVFFAAQRSNLFSNSYQALRAASAFQSLPASVTDNWRSPVFIATGSQVPMSSIKSLGGVRFVSAPGRRAAMATRTSDDYISLDGGGVILVRGQNGEREMTVPTVSVGAQPLLYSSRPSQPVRSVSVSF